MKKRAIVLAVVGLVVLVVALLAMGWFPQEILRSSVESRLRAALGPKSSIKRIHVVPGKFRAEVWDLVIEGPTYRLEIPHGTLAVAPGFVLGRDLVLNSLVLEGPRLVVHPAPGPATEPTLRRPVLVRDLKITGATVTYAPAPPGSEILVRDVAATGAIGFDGMLDVSAAGGVWRRPQPLDLTATRARLKVSSKLDVEIESFEGGTARSRIALSGSLGRVGMLHPDLKLDADLGLRDARQLSEGLPALDGRVKLSGRLRQPADTIAVEARVEGSAMELAGWPLDRASGTVSYDEAGEGHAAVNLSLAGLGGEGRTELTFVGSRVQGRMRFTGVDATQLARQGVSLGVPFAGALSGDVTGTGDLHTGLNVQATLGADGRALDGYPVKARGSASGRVRPRERFVDLRWTLNVDAIGRAGTSPPGFEALHIAGQGQAQGVLPPAVDGAFEGSASLRTETGSEPIPVKGRFRSSGGAATVNLDAQVLGGTVTAGADLRRSIVKKLDVTAAALDLGRLSPRAKGQASLALTASGPLDGLSGEGHVEATGVTWAGASVGNVAADLHGTAGVARFTVAAPDLNLTGEGQLDRRQVAATLHLADTPLAPLEPMLSPGRPLAGKASGTVDVTLAFGSPSPPVVQARLDAVEVASGTLTARSVRPFTITSRDRGVEVQDLQLEAPGVSFQGSGSVGFDRGSAITLKGTIDADLTKLSLPPDWKAGGRVRGDVAVTGSLDKPHGEGAVTLTGVTLQRPGWPLVRVEDGAVRAEGDEAVASGLHVILPGGTMNVSGRVPLAALVSDPATRERFGLGAGRGLDLHADLDLDLAALSESTGWTLAGRAQGQVTLTGTLGQLSPRGTLTLDGVRFARPGMPVVTIPAGQVALEGDTATTEGLTAHVAGGAVALTGSLPLAAVMGEEKAAGFGFAPGEARGEAVWDGVEVQQLFEEMRPDQPSPIKGTLAGQVELHGSLASPRNLSGGLELPATTLRIQDLPVEVSAVRVRIENGQVRAEPVTLTAQGGTLLLTGSADLVRGTIEGSGKGALQLRTLSPFLEQAFLDGQAEVDVSLSGPLAAPASRGTVRVHDAAMRIRGVSQALTGINGTLSLDGRRMTLQDMSASLGGGELKMSGSAALAGLRLSDVDVSFTARNAGVRYPVGGISRASNRLGDIKARIDADLKLTGQQGALLLGGTIDVKRALYDADIYLGEGLFARAVPPGSTTPSRFLQSFALDIRVKTENPAVVRNNLAQLQATGSWSVRGDLDTPALYGGLELLPGGKAFLQGREFAIENGRISHSGSPDPAISVRATTDYHDVDIEGRLEDVQMTVTVGGTIDVPTVSLTSDQALTEEQLVLLVTAGTTSTSQTGGAIAGQQAALLFSQRFTRDVSRGLSGLGFDQVDIQPELLSPEADPGARFTFGKDVLPNLRIIYSFGLNSTESQYYEARYRLRLRHEALFAARRFEDGTLEYSAGQRFRLGGPPRPAARGGQRGRARLQEVNLEGDRPGQPLELTGDLAEAELRKQIQAKPGKTASYFDLSDDSDRLRQYLVEQGYLEAIVEPDRQEAVAVFRVRPGPKYTWRVEGMDRPPDLRKVVLKSLFAEEAQERGRDALLDELRRRGHLKATVESSEVPEGAGRTLVFTVTPGPVLTVAEVTFPGAAELKPSELEKAAGGAARIYAGPKEAERAIVAAYREKQFLAAKAGPTKIVEEGGQVRIAVPVDEGPPALLSAVRFEATHRPESELRSLAGIETGYPYDPNAVTAAVQRIRNRYLGLGYPAVRVLSEVTPDGSDLVLTFRILEGEARVVGPVTITGLSRTRAWLVRGQVDIAPGDPLDPRKLSEIERRLLQLGVFSRATVTTEAGNPAPIKIELQEAPPYKLGYDLRYNTSDGGSGLVDAEVGNLFGTGLTLGGRFRAGRELRDTRAWVHLPSLWKLGDLTATAFRLREILAQEIPPVPPDVPTEPTVSIQKGIQGQFDVHLHPVELLYGYRFKQTTITSPIFVFPINPRVAGLNASVVLNTRGNILDPIVGRFYSLALSYDDSLLGSDFSFIKGFGQAFFNHLITQRITWAQGYRLGLAWGLHGDRVPGFTPEFSERFNAGGSNSVRGYETDGLGPVDAFGDHVGGEAVLVINQELRFQGTSTLGAAVFYDVGNVYAQVKDFDLSLRQSLGAGLRYQSPIGLLRFDVGFPLNRRPEERRYQIWFGLGQAF